MGISLGPNEKCIKSGHTQNPRAQNQSFTVYWRQVFRSVTRTLQPGVEADHNLGQLAESQNKTVKYHDDLLFNSLVYGQQQF
jgi:hypothetical protein